MHQACLSEDPGFLYSMSWMLQQQDLPAIIPNSAAAHQWNLDIPIRLYVFLKKCKRNIMKLSKRGSVDVQTRNSREELKWVREKYRELPDGITLQHIQKVYISFGWNGPLHNV